MNPRRPSTTRSSSRLAASGDAASCRFCGSPRLAPAGSVDGFRFLECRDCAFAFTPDVTAEMTQRRYGAADRERDAARPAEGWASLDFLQPALSLAETGARLRIIDFGTGQSIVPDLLRQRGHRVIAVDLMPPRTPHPDRLTGDVRQLPLPGGFDLIFSFQVFEHLAEPRPVFERLLDLLRPGGYLAIHTDMEVEERTPALEDWWYVMPPTHCSFYRHRSFEWVLRGARDQLVHLDPKMVIVRRG